MYTKMDVLSISAKNVENISFKAWDVIVEYAQTVTKDMLISGLFL